MNKKIIFLLTVFFIFSSFALAGEVTVTLVPDQEGPFYPGDTFNLQVVLGPSETEVYESFVLLSLESDNFEFDTGSIDSSTIYDKLSKNGFVTEEKNHWQLQGTSGNALVLGKYDHNILGTIPVRLLDSGKIYLTLKDSRITSGVAIIGDAPEHIVKFIYQPIMVEEGELPPQLDMTFGEPTYSNLVVNGKSVSSFDVDLLNLGDASVPSEMSLKVEHCVDELCFSTDALETFPIKSGVSKITFTSMPTGTLKMTIVAEGDVNLDNNAKTIFITSAEPECSSNVDCVNGEICQDGVCIILTPETGCLNVPENSVLCSGSVEEDGVQAKLGEFCVKLNPDSCEYTCLEGYSHLVNALTGIGTCVLEPECNSNADCLVGEYCYQNSCLMIPAECSLDTDCADKDCINGQCTDILTQIRNILENEDNTLQKISAIANALREYFI